MRFNLSIILITFCASNLLAQNFIQNGGFKDTLVGNFNIITPNYWSSATSSSPDFLHPSTRDPWKVPLNLNGFQNAKLDNGYYGIVLYSKSRSSSREYIQNELSTSLLKDSAYCLQFFMSLADSSNYALKNQLGVLFSNNKVNLQINSVIPFTPDIEFIDSTYFTEKELWVKVSGRYLAQGGERYFILGHFKNSIDIDTLKINGGNNISHNGVYYYLDDFFLGHCDSLPEDTAIGLRENSLKDKLNVYPNPFENRVVVNYEGNQRLNFILYNLLGKEVIVSPTGTINNRYALDLGDLPKGIYFLSVSDGVNRVTKKLIKQ